MIHKRIKGIFKKGSVTYYWSSLFFPKSVREDVFNLYAFVRIADNFVDSKNQNRDGFTSFRKKFEKAYKSQKICNDLVIDNFIKLTRRRNFNKRWVDAFLDSMRADFNGNVCSDFPQIKKYMYGSAEVIGLMMAQIMSLPQSSHESAKMLGRAYQYLNIIRDVSTDNSLKRIYIPLSEIKKYGLSNLTRPTNTTDEQKFVTLIRAQIDIYKTWMVKAKEGYRYIPPRLLIPIMTSSDMYDWTAQVIYKNPLIVFEKVVKPSPSKVILCLIRNTICQLPAIGYWCAGIKHVSIKHGKI
ncbi:phytoene/squalene synthase family protein [Candidatus Woesebacteria bacterium]|nr:MAG: phytoene/squalene synthase family protein [Candidatus Woesebacteria bacterium]